MLAAVKARRAAARAEARSIRARRPTPAHSPHATSLDAFTRLYSEQSADCRRSVEIMAYKAERMRERLAQLAPDSKRAVSATQEEQCDIGDRQRLERLREFDRSAWREKSPPRINHEQPIPDADLPPIGSITLANVTSIKGNLGLFVETPALNGAKISGLIHLSEVCIVLASLASSPFKLVAFRSLPGIDIGNRFDSNSGL